MRASGYQPALDGLRAVAVLGVLGFHLSPGRLQGGFTGVDVFFVLSGYLISGIILRGLGTGSFSLTDFYTRRALRLLPNLVAMVVCVVAVWAALFPQSELVETANHAIWTLLSASNLYIYLNLGGYWGASAKSAPLTHAWSLGIEEQFYLLFPVILCFAWWRARNSIGIVLWGLFTLSAISCLWQTQDQPSLVFYMVPFRAWELLAGALLAHAMAGGSAIRGGAAVQLLAGAIGLAAIGACYLWLPKGIAFPGWVASIPVFATVLVIYSVMDRSSLVARALGLPFLAAIGRRSYSLYLWHWPTIIVCHRVGPELSITGRSLTLVSALLSVLLAELAYRFIERPLREGSAPLRWRLRTMAGGMAGAVAISVSVSVFVHPVADPGSCFDTPVSYTQYFNAGLRAPPAALRSPRYYDVQFPMADFSGVERWRTGGIIRQHGDGNPRVVVLGSSHALMYSGLIDRICADAAIPVAFLGVDATPVFMREEMGSAIGSRTDGKQFNSIREEMLRRWRPAIVFVIDRWDGFAGDEDGFKRELGALVSLVRESGGLAVFVNQVPVIDIGDTANLREIASREMLEGGDLPTLQADGRADARNRLHAIAEAMAAQNPSLRIIKADQRFLRSDGSVCYADGRKILYIDDDHLSEDGSEKMRVDFRAVIEDSLAR